MRRAARAAGRASWLALAGGALALLAVQCGAPSSGRPEGEPVVAGNDAAAAAAWQVIYGVLQHPRCLNCHPAGDAPLQGDSSLPHAQNVQRGPAGQGRYGMRCDACHQESNADGPNLPPGAPGWHLPRPGQPLVFQGRNRRELCLQLRDPARNGGKSPEQVFEHMAADPLVLWGWSPGPGRTPVPTPHDELVRALRTWVDGGCGCPPEAAAPAATAPQ